MRVHGAVADSVDGALKSLTVCTPEDVVEALPVPVQDAGVLAI